jgi:diaminohydroxyphosphoribosylaminopyrimidine deaminase/5-amino-6-(5-phosphoribosylamino)uracil reductase
VLGDRCVPDDAAVRRHPRPLLHRPGNDLTAVLDELRERGVQRVFIEGGPTVASAFVRDDLADEVLAYVAPTLLGSGADGSDRPALRRLGVDTITQQRRLAVESVHKLGDDLLIVAHPNTQEKS